MGGGRLNSVQAEVLLNHNDEGIRSPGSGSPTGLIMVGGQRGRKTGAKARPWAPGTGCSRLCRERRPMHLAGSIH